MTYLLDTNILLIYIRNQEKRETIEEEYQIFSKNNTAIISIVSLGEIKSIAKRNYWGIKKLHQVEKILESLVITNINVESIVEKYAEIDAFSQNKIKDNPLPMTARNMGKNDLWIAATASVTNASLITTDKDFRHLSDTYLQLIEIDIAN